MHGYAYGNNSPVLKADPSGLVPAVPDPTYTGSPDDMNGWLQEIAIESYINYVTPGGCATNWYPYCESIVYTETDWRVEQPGSCQYAGVGCEDPRLPMYPEPDKPSPPAASEEDECWWQDFCDAVDAVDTWISENADIVGAIAGAVAGSLCFAVATGATVGAGAVAAGIGCGFFAGAVAGWLSSSISGDSMGTTAMNMVTDGIIGGLTGGLTMGLGTWLSGAARSAANGASAGNGASTSAGRDVAAYMPTGRKGLKGAWYYNPNPSATISGIRYSGHAIDRMQQRGILPMMVEDVLANGTRVADGGARLGEFTYTHNGIKVAVNSDFKVITVMFSSST